MIPVQFEQQNLELQPPPDMSNGECSPLPVCVSETAGRPVAVSCWEVTPEELQRIQETGRVWLLVWGDVHPPVGVTGINPFG